MERVALLAQVMLAGRMGTAPNLLSAEGTYIIPAGDETPFRMVTTGSGLVVAVCPELLDWSRSHLSFLSYGEAFEARWIARIERALRESVGGVLRGPYQMFYCLPDRYDILDSPINRNFRLLTVSGAELPQYINPGLFETGLQRLQPTSTFEIAFVDNKPLGVCGGVPNAHGLLSLCVEVLPEWQSRGIGTWMIKHAINSFIVRGYHIYCRASLADMKSTRLCHRLRFRLGWLELVGERAPASDQGDDLESALRATPWDLSESPPQKNGRTKGS